MKQILIILSSLTTLTLASNMTVNVVNNTIINNKLNSNPSNGQTPSSLFNNKFGYLSQDKWITNQSTTDHKYYSYDTSHAVGNLSDGTTPFRNAFFVDSNGNLAIDSSLNLSNANKNMLNNMQAEMINHKQVTSIKDDYNVYSKSIFSDSYFSGDNSSWKYLQMGGIENHIDISSQQSANKVEHSNSLSETLGLYYIAQAERNPGGIDMAVATSLGKYFISKSSLKNLDDSVTSSIINIIATSNNVYNLLYQSPPRDGEGMLYKNYATNYIFDSNNNLIEIYYSNWNTDNLTLNVNTNDSASAGSFNYGYKWWWSDPQSIVNWKKIANNWDNFTSLYPTFVFGNNSYLQVKNGNTGSKKFSDLNANTNCIKDKQPPDLSNFDNAYTNDWNSDDYYKFIIEKDYDNGYYWSQMCFALYLWHDDNNIYYQASSVIAVHDVDSDGYGYQYNLDNITFNNGMK